MAFAAYAFFFLAGPLAETVVQDSSPGFLVGVVEWILRIAVILNVLALACLVFKVIDVQEGEWPN